MKKLLMVLLALMLALGCIGCGSDGSDKTEKAEFSITLINMTGTVLGEVNVTGENSDSWGDNRLGSAIANGAEEKIDIADLETAEVKLRFFDKDDIKLGNVTGLKLEDRDSVTVYYDGASLACGINMKLDTGSQTVQNQTTAAQPEQTTAAPQPEQTTAAPQPEQPTAAQPSQAPETQPQTTQGGEPIENWFSYSHELVYDDLSGDYEVEYDGTKIKYRDYDYQIGVNAPSTMITNNSYLGGAFVVGDGAYGYVVVRNVTQDVLYAYEFYHYDDDDQYLMQFVDDYVMSDFEALYGGTAELCDLEIIAKNKLKSSYSSGINLNVYNDEFDMSVELVLFPSTFSDGSVCYLVKAEYYFYKDTDQKQGLNQVSIFGTRH